MKPTESKRIRWPVAAAALAVFIAMGISHHTVVVAFAEEVLTNDNVIAMARAGLPEAVIIAKIQSTQTQFDLTTNGLIALKQAGVPDSVLVTMVNRQAAGTPGPPTAGAPGVPAPTAPGMAGPPTPTAGSGYPPVGAQPPPSTLGGNFAPTAAGCPQLAQPDPYQGLRGTLGQYQAQAAQPGTQVGQYLPLVTQLQSTLDARDAALRQGACDTTQYDTQISTLGGNLQTAMASSPPPGGATPFPQQAGAPGLALGAPQSPGPEGQNPLGSGGGDMVSKLFDSLQGLAGKSRGGGDSGGGGMMGSPSGGAYSPGPASPSDPGTSPGPTGGSDPGGGGSSPSTPSGPPAIVRGTVKNQVGAAIANAKITAVEWNTYTTTAPDGSYYLQGPGAPQVTLQAEAVGYQKKSNVTSVPPGAVTWQYFSLQKAPVAPPSKIQISPGLRQRPLLIPRP